MKLHRRIATLFVVATALLTAARVEQVAGGEVDASAGPARELRLVEPFAVDFGAGGDWYICEYKGQRILRVDRNGNASVFAGTGQPGYSGDGADASKAALRDPHGIVIASGSMYVADTLNHAIRRIDLKSRTITTIAGTGEKGAGGDGGPGPKASFNGTFGIAIHPSGDRLYIADLGNRRVRVLHLRNGIVNTLAGNGESRVPTEGGPAESSPLVDPRAVAVDSKGLVYILERNGNALRTVDRAGRVHTVIAPGTLQPALKGPKHLCVDRQDRVIIADAENHLIRRYDPKTGITATIAGTGEKGHRIDPADPLKTQLNRPHGVAVDRSGALWISDSYNHRILRISGL